MPVVNIRSGAVYDVYIGRPSPWGNPYRTGSKAERVERYRHYLWNLVREDPQRRVELAELRGKTLGCWCKPEPCHGDVLERAAEWAAHQ